MESLKRINLSIEKKKRNVPLIIQKYTEMHKCKTTSNKYKNNNEITANGHHQTKKIKPPQKQTNDNNKQINNPLISVSNKNQRSQ